MTLEEVLKLVEDNNLERDVFMHLYRESDKLNEQMSSDDCAEVWTGILKGSDDITAENLETLAWMYDVDLDEVLGR